MLRRARWRPAILTKTPKICGGGTTGRLFQTFMEKDGTISPRLAMDVRLAGRLATASLALPLSSFRGGKRGKKTRGNLVDVKRSE